LQDNFALIEHVMPTALSKGRGSPLDGPANAARILGPQRLITTLGERLVKWKELFFLQACLFQKRVAMIQEVTAPAAR
jgi:hypothetical protein